MRPSETLILLFVIVAALVPERANAEMSDAELLEAYLEDIPILTPFSSPLATQSDLYPEVIGRGPNMLVMLMPMYKDALKDFFDGSEDARVRREYAQRLDPLYYVARQLTGVYYGETHGLVKDLRSRYEQSQEVPEAPHAGASEETEKKPVHEIQLVDWWDARGLFLDSMDREKEIGRLRQSVDGEGMLTREAIKELSKSVYLYGIYAIPMYVDGVREYNDPVSFFSLCRTQKLQPYMVWERKPYKAYKNVTSSEEETFKYMLESYSSKASKVKFVSEWWAEKKHTFTRLEDLYAAIDTAVKEAEASIEAQGSKGIKIAIAIVVVLLVVGLGVRMRRARI